MSFASFTRELGMAMKLVGDDILSDHKFSPAVKLALQQLTDNYPVDYALVTDATGTVTASTNSQLIGQDFSHDAVFTKLRASGELNSIEPVELGGYPAGFHISRALRDSTGELILTVTSFVNLAKLHDTLPVLVEDGETHIVDSNGRLVFLSTNANYPLTKPLWNKYSFVRDALYGREVFRADFIDPLKGKEDLVSEVPIPGIGWAAGSDITVDSALAPIRTSVESSAVFALLALFVAFFISTCFARRITGSISTLVDGAKVVGEGYFTAPITVKTGDELEELALSLDKARLNLKRRDELSRALSNINTTINSMLDFDKIIERVLVDAAQSLGFEAGMILLRCGNQWVVRYLYGFPDGHVGPYLTMDEAKTSTLVAQTKELVFIGDVEYDDRCNRELSKKHGFRSKLVIPLIVKGDVVGVVHFITMSSLIALSEIQLDFATKLATAVSLALENARLYEIERNIADILQESLLTLPAKLEGIEFKSLYKSATEVARVGGDFYDLFALGHKRIGIIVGDVSGKGLEASTITSMIKNIIKAYAYDNDSPAAIIAKANEVTVKLLEPSLFVTAFFGILSLETGELTYCSAGQPPALVRRAGSSIEALDEMSPIIGAFADVPYSEATISLEAGDILVVYTDGVVEARKQGEFYGEQRLEELMRETISYAVSEIPSAIFDSVIDFTGGEFSDDMAILAVSFSERTP